MTSQWDCLLKNVGVWQGSFTRLSAQGEVIENTPTIVALEGLEQNQVMRQVVQLYAPDAQIGDVANRPAPVKETVLQYRSLGRGVLFLETGAFSQGSLQFAPYAEFGVELGLIHGDRRLRLVQQFDQTGQLAHLTLIRERLAESQTAERPLLQVVDLLGDWQGEAVTIAPDWYISPPQPTVLTIWQENNRLMQRLTFGPPDLARTLTSSATIDGSVLHFDQGAMPIQILLLADGASSNCPTQVKLGHPFVLEVGWLIQPNLRQRLVRSYNAKGEWTGMTLVTERRVAAVP